MKRASFILALAASLLTFGRLAAAETSAREATVAKATGNVVVMLPDGSVKPLTAGMKVPQGSTITTGADGDVYLESHAGYVTAIKQDSVVKVDEISVTTEGGKVKEEKTLLDLKSGNLVAKLDPSKKAVNNYQVRTPKGVAAARGTVFTVSYKGGNYTIAVVNGVVTITPPAGGGVAGTDVGIQVNAGQATFSGVDADLSTPAYFNQNLFGGNGESIAELLSIAVATVAVAAQNNIGGTTAAELRDVADAVIKAVPSAAPAIAALVAVSAPTQSAAITASTAANAPAQSAAVEQAVRATQPTTTTTPAGETTTTPSTTTPQPIDPSTVSRSG